MNPTPEIKTKRLITVDSAIEAEILKEKLQSEGIFSILSNENYTNLFPGLYGIAQFGVEIFVDEQDFQKAIDILKIEEKPRIYCPECGSENIKIGIGGYNLKLKLIYVFTLIISLITGPMKANKSTMLCQDCQFRF